MKENAVVYASKDTLDLWRLSCSPYISVQQYLKGTLPGVYVQAVSYTHLDVYKRQYCIFHS